MFKFIPIFLVLAVSLSPVWAQVTSATIRGTVTDSTGGVLPGVDITITHLDTNSARMGLNR